jgi:alpha/beta superfamily hydrolase
MEVAAITSSAPTAVEHYGRDPLQLGELRLPHGEGPFPVAIIIHGGCFAKGYATQSYMRPLAAELTRRGIATWNIEYRQVGDMGGGWPGTFLDWAAAADHLRRLAQHHPLDLSRVVAAGHSAGASAALWLAARPQLSSGSEIRGQDPLHVDAAIAIDGPADLAGWIGEDAAVCSLPVIVPLFGGTPRQLPQRYALGDPARMPAPALPSILFASTVLSAQQAERFAALHARSRTVALEDAGHFDMLAPERPSFTRVIDAIVAIIPPQR